MVYLTTALSRAMRDVTSSAYKAREDECQQRISGCRSTYLPTHVQTREGELTCVARCLCLMRMFICIEGEVFTISNSYDVIKLFGDPIIWRSHKKTYLTLSTCQAEYLAMSDASQELVSLDKAIRDTIGKTMYLVTIWCDNKLAIDCTQMDGSHKFKNFDYDLETIRMNLESREKSGSKSHMTVTHGDYIKSCVLEGKVIVRWISTKENEADIMTKPLPIDTHKYLRDKIMISE